MKREIKINNFIYNINLCLLPDFSQVVSSIIIVISLIYIQDAREVPNRFWEEAFYFKWNVYNVEEDTEM